MAGLVDIYGGVKNNFELDGALGGLYGGIGANIGRQQAENAVQKQLSDLYTIAQAQKQADIMNPLDAQYKQGQISQLSALLPGQQAKSKEEQLTYEDKFATHLSDIASKQATNATVKERADAERHRNSLNFLQTDLKSGIPMEVALTKLEPQQRELFKGIQSKLPMLPEESTDDHARRVADVLSKTAKSYMDTYDQNAVSQGKFLNAKNIADTKAVSAMDIAQLKTESQESIQQMKIDAGQYAKHEKTNVEMFNKLDPLTKDAVIKASLFSDIDPITKQKMTDEQRIYNTALSNALSTDLAVKYTASQAGKAATDKLIPGAPSVATPMPVIPMPTVPSVRPQTGMPMPPVGAPIPTTTPVQKAVLKYDPISKTWK